MSCVSCLSCVSCVYTMYIYVTYIFRTYLSITGEATPASCPGMSATWPFLLVRCLPEGPGFLNSGTELIDIVWKKNIFWKASLTVYSVLSLNQHNQCSRWNHCMLLYVAEKNAVNIVGSSQCSRFYKSARRARDYLSWLLKQRTGTVYVDTSSRALLPIVGSPWLRLWTSLKDSYIKGFLYEIRSK